MSDDVKQEQKTAVEVKRRKFVLSKPIMVFDEEVSELNWREPNGTDFVKIGNPVKFQPFTSPVSIEHDMQKMIAMLSRLTGAPSSSLERLSPNDLATLAWEVTPFFIPRM